MTTWQALRLDALDVLFFRDGRPFEAATQVRSILPLPHTVAGAVRSALLRQHGVDLAQLGRWSQSGLDFATALTRLAPSLAWIADVEIVGPWFCQHDTVYVPCPATLYRKNKDDDDSDFCCFAPLERPLHGWEAPLADMRPLWPCNADSLDRRLLSPKPAGGYLSLQGLKQYLGGEVPDKKHWKPARCFAGHDLRTGIGVDAVTNTAGDGNIYAVGFLALRAGVRLHVEVCMPEGAPPLPESIPPLPLGGESRHVAVDVVPSLLAQQEEQTAQGRSCFVLLSPAIFDQGWYSQRMASGLLGAAVPGCTAFSGWDMARQCPKHTRFAANAGSVYFYESNMPHDHVRTASQDAALGFGFTLKGVW